MATIELDAENFARTITENDRSRRLVGVLTRPHAASSRAIYEQAAFNHPGGGVRES